MVVSDFLRRAKSPSVALLIKICIVSLFTCLTYYLPTYLPHCRTHHISYEKSFERRAYVLTLGGRRWKATSKELRRVGLAALSVSPVPLTSPEIQRKQEHGFSLMAQKTYSNYLTFLHVLDLIHNDTAHKSEWIYVFEDDIIVNPNVSEKAVPNLLKAAERAAAKSEDIFLYGGVCLRGLVTSTTTVYVEGYAMKYKAGRCAHAWAVAPGKALDLKLRIKRMSRDKHRFNECADIYVDCALEAIAMNSTHVGMVTPAADNCDKMQMQHCGVFLQDRKRFPTGIGRRLLEASFF